MAPAASVTVLVAALAAAGGAILGALAVACWRTRTRRVRTAALGPTVSELLVRIVRRSQAGLAVVNRFGDVVLSNDRAEELGAVVDARPEPRVAATVAKVVLSGQPAGIDLSPDASFGRAPRSVLVSVRPLDDGYVVVEASDTSDAVRLEAVRRDFVANVGHELKTPVGALAVLAEAVLDADDPEEVARFANKILHESRRLGSLVTELIELSRLQGAERLPELAPVDVDDVVARAFERAGTSAETAGTRLTADGPSGLRVAGSPGLLVTALTNLLENAIAYSPEGSPVSVRRRLVGDRVEISVTDRGIGIAAEHQQRVFERFFRVDPARSRATGGTGLGLAIVKHVAANHGGDVRLWSEPGIGSTFTLRIPAADRPGPAPAASPAPATAPSPASSPARRRAVLEPLPGHTGGSS